MGAGRLGDGQRASPSRRQIASRAKQHVAAKRPRFTPSREEQERLTRQFVETCTNGDLEGLLALLAEDVVAQSDGGGKVTSARRPIYGANKVARFMLGVLPRLPADYTMQIAEVNGQPALIGYTEGRPYNVLTPESRRVIYWESTMC